MAKEELIKGFVVANEEGKYLNRNSRWVTTVANALVYSPDQLIELAFLVKERKWKKQPRYVTPAIYDSDLLYAETQGVQQEFSSVLLRIRKHIQQTFEGTFSHR